MDSPNVDDESNAGASVPKASVSTPEDVRNRIKKNLTGLEKEHFSPRMSSQREYAPRVFLLLRI